MLCKARSIFTLEGNFHLGHGFVVFLGAMIFVYDCTVAGAQGEGKPQRCHEELTATSHELTGWSPIRKAAGRSGQRDFFAMTDDTEQLVSRMLPLQPRLRLLRPPRAKMLALRSHQKAAALMVISHIT